MGIFAETQLKYIKYPMKTSFFYIRMRTFVEIINKYIVFL